MKVLLDIKESKATFVMELLNSLSFVKAEALTNEKAMMMYDIKESTQQLKLIQEGKLKGISAKELLDEL